jgi:hypothetical protein
MWNSKSNKKCWNSSTNSFQLALVHSIKQAISDRITYLKKAKGMPLSPIRFIPGLHLYYSQGIATERDC